MRRHGRRRTVAAHRRVPRLLQRGDIHLDLTADVYLHVSEILVGEDVAVEFFDEAAAQRP